MYAIDLDVAERLADVARRGSLAYEANESLTASPTTVYRCDPIEGSQSFFYSVTHAREYCQRANRRSGT
jgi:hypothetical protein